MPWIRMRETHHRVWGPAGPRDRRVTTKYREGASYLVKRAVADELVDEKGVAERLKRRPSEGGERRSHEGAD